jgi:hypothetical protein
MGRNNKVRNNRKARRRKEREDRIEKLTLERMARVADNRIKRRLGYSTVINEESIPKLSIEEQLAKIKEIMKK